MEEYKLSELKFRELKVKNVFEIIGRGIVWLVDLESNNLPSNRIELKELLVNTAASNKLDNKIYSINAIEVFPDTDNTEASIIVTQYKQKI